MKCAGLDIGTTGCKVSVYDESAVLCGTYYTEYDVSRKLGLSEINPDDIRNGVINVLSQASKLGDIASIAVTSFGETFVMLDKDDKSLFPSMLYTDPRGTDEAQYLLSRSWCDELTMTVGTRPHAMYSLPKLMWIKNNKPELYSKAKRVLLMQDYIVYMLCGAAQIDYSLAARTMAFDIQNKCWYSRLFDEVMIDKSLFSTPVPSGTYAGKLRGDLALLTGLGKDTAIVSGFHDQIAAVTGAGVTDESAAMDGIGTVECMPVILNKVPSDTKLYDKGFSVVPTSYDGKYACYILSFTGGASLKWFRDSFAKGEYEAAKAKGENVYRLLDEKAPENPTDLLVLPHFAGAATPYMDSFSKAAIIGLTFETSVYDIYKALMEGVSFEILLNMNILSEYTTLPKKILATGGGATSDVWLQIKADIMNLKITSLNCEQVGGAGTAYIAGKAIGMYSENELELMVPPRKIFMPDKVRHEIYEKKFAKYLGLYEDVRRHIQ